MASGSIEVLSSHDWVIILKDGKKVYADRTVFVVRLLELLGFSVTLQEGAFVGGAEPKDFVEGLDGDDEEYIIEEVRKSLDGLYVDIRDVPSN